MRNLLVIYEAPEWDNYGALAALRPIFCLRTGMNALWQSLKSLFPDFDLQFICRPEVAHVALRESGIVANRIRTEGYQRVIFIDASTRPDEGFLAELQQAERSRFFKVAERIVAVVLVGEQTKSAVGVAGSFSSMFSVDSSSVGSGNSLVADLDSVGLESAEIEVERYAHLWDLTLASPANIVRDFDIMLRELGSLREHNLAERLDTSKVIGDGQTFIHPTASVLPDVVFDSTSGPVYIDEGTLVEPGSYIVGPFYAGANCRILGGKLGGSALGPFCQIAGELEESVIQGYVNKHHAGFIGHSYIGEWVNFGAMTTNSDLKNNYSTVRVAVKEEMIDSGSNKIGSFIGDHTKFGIGTLLNTGISIGIFCNVFGGTLVTDKSVPSFSWGGLGSWQRHEVEKALQTAKLAMARRDRALADEDIKLIRSLSGQ